MFCGIVEEVGRVTANTGRQGEARFTIAGKEIHDDLREGDSVSVNGVCLTATALEAHSFSVDVSPETLRVTNLGALESASSVNLERSMRLDQRIGGHLVSGHVDGVGTIIQRHHVGNAIEFHIAADGAILRYCIVKGSIAVDGVSLTINRISHSAFDIAIIPHTAETTTFGCRNVGDLVNIENDLIGKYVERLCAVSERSGSRP